MNRQYPPQPAGYPPKRQPAMQDPGSARRPNEGLNEPYYPPQEGRNPSGSSMPPVQPAKKGHGLKTVLMILALLVVVGVILHSTLFKVRTIAVYGNVNFTDEEIVLQSGMAVGQNILAVDKKQVEERINQNRYLKFQSLRRDYPDAITLVVYERVPCTSLKSLGVQYTLDKTGMVLEATQVLTPEEGLVVLTGMKVNKAVVGRTIEPEDARQLALYEEILYELESKGMLEGISELNVSDLDNLYLVSVDGYSIHLGSAEQIGAKLISYTAVREALIGMGKYGGTIDVSSPVYPTYIP